MTRVTYQDIPVTRAVFCDSFPLKFVHDSTDSTPRTQTLNALQQFKIMLEI